MKKVMFMLFAAVMMLGVTNVHAMTEEELHAKLTGTYTINGKDFTATSKQKVELERYLKEFDVSEKDADYISGKFDEALKVLEEEKAASFSDLSKNAKAKLIDVVADVSKNTDVKVTLTEGGKLTIYGKDGKTPFAVFTDSDMTIQNTNADMAIVVAASVISLLGVAVVSRKVAKANA